MAGKVVEKIKDELNQAVLYTIIADETKDISKKKNSYQLYYDMYTVV